jgi:hypothetical protein
MTDYQTAITCTIPIVRAYQAITQEMFAWWTPMSAPFVTVGDRAKTNFGGPSFWVFEAAILSKPDFIELICCESHMVADSLHDPHEWLGTKLRFALTEQDAKTSIIFTHCGLNPELQCYEICKAGWDHYIPGSLKRYLEGEGGKPNSYQEPST